MSLSNLSLSDDVNKSVGVEQLNYQNNLQDYKNRLAKTIAECYTSEKYALVESLPITGKTYSTFKQAQETDTPILYLTSLNRLKKKAIEKCDKFGLSYHKIPVPQDLCPSFDGKHGLEKLYRRGISAKELHEYPNLELPCSDSCPYIEELNKDVSMYDVLIGNPKHAYNDNYLQGRSTVKDEFSADEYEIEYNKPRELINRFIQSVRTFPLNSFTEIQNSDEEDKKEALDWFRNYSVYRDTATAHNPEDYHVHAPLLTYALLTGIEVNSEWYKSDIGHSDLWDIDTSIGDNAQVVFDSRKENMYLLNPPNFEVGNGFIGLDGTPISEFWECATGTELEHIQVMDLQEKKEYITDSLNLEIKVLTDNKRYYQNSTNIAETLDTGLAYSIFQKEGEKPGLITSNKALDEYGDKIHEYVEIPKDRNGNYLHFERVLSNNQFKNKQLGFVTGMRNYGDEYIIKWGCYLDKSVSVDRSGNETEYSFGQETFNIFPLWRKQSLQDVLRFGRNEEPTTVYVNTCALPEWVPVSRENIEEHSRVKLSVIHYLRNNQDERYSRKEIATATDNSKKQVGRMLEELEEVTKKYESSGAFTPTKYEWYGN